jgi:hypothetical protein
MSKNKSINTWKWFTDEKKISIGEWVRDAIETALSNIQQKEDTM